MAQPIVAGIGEILFDIVDGDERLGGAPVNYAFHANCLGAHGLAITTVGEDERGQRALVELAARGLAVDCVSVLAGKMTGYVEASLDEDGIASYYFPEEVAWDYLQLGDAARKMAGKLSAICFGTLAQRSPVSRSVIRWYLEHLLPGTLKVYDVNLRQDFYSYEIISESLRLADVVKLNDEEILVLAEMQGLSGSHEAMLQDLVARYSLTLAILTRGGKGSLLVTSSQMDDHPGVAVAELKDTIGAGDSFTAAVTMGLLRGEALAAINQSANELAARVCASSGAMVKVV